MYNDPNQMNTKEHEVAHPGDDSKTDRPLIMRLFSNSPNGQARVHGSVSTQGAQSVIDNGQAGYVVRVAS
jgi:hypothetical protein